MAATTPGIGTAEPLPTSHLNLYHRNPRRGDVDAIADSLAANGQYRPVVVNRGSHTGREWEILAGNHTVMAVRQLAEQHPDDARWQNVDCWVVDVDEDRATRIVLADNRTADLGGYDNDELLALLDSLDGDTIDDQLDGTGYDEGYLNALLGGNTPNEWQPDPPDPGPQHEATSETEFRVVIDCHTILEQQQTVDELTTAGYTARAEN